MNLNKAVILLFISLLSFFKGFSVNREVAIQEAVIALNRQIDINEELKKQGKEEQTSYIVDLRQKWWDGINENVSSSELQEEDKKLRAYNQKHKVAYYTILSAPFVESATSHYDPRSGKTRFIYSGKYYEFTNEQLSSPEYATLIEKIRKENEQSTKEYTKAVFTRSKLGNKTNKGILLNVDGVVSGYYSENSRGLSNEEKLKIQKDQKKIRYYGSLALGKRLSGASVEKAVASLLQGLKPKTYNFNSNFSTALSHYIETIGNNIPKLGDIDEFKKDETGTQLESGIFIYPKNSSDLLYNLKNHRQKFKQEILTQRSSGKTLTVYDYAGLVKYDPDFIKTLDDLFGKEDSDQSLKELTEGFPYSIDLYITSDSSLAMGKTAIQLAAEKRNISKDGRKLLVGIHLQLATPKSVGDAEIKFQVLSYYNDFFKETIQLNGKENGYDWWKNLRTGKIYYSKMKGIKTTRWGLNIYNGDEWERQGAFFIKNGGKLKYNDFSSNLLFAQVQNGLVQNDQYIDDHRNELSVVVVQVVFTVGTAGIGGEGLAAYVAIKELIKEGGKKVIIGFALDYIAQAIIIKFFEGEDFETALTKVSSIQALGAGLENIVDGNVYQELVKGCFSNAAIQYLEDKQTLNISSVGFKCAEGVGQAILTNFFLIPEFAKTKYGRLAKLKFRGKVSELKAKLKNELGLNEENINRIIKELGLEDASKILSKGFDDLKLKRKELGLPEAGSSSDDATVAKITINGKDYFGVNSKYQNPKSNIKLKVNAQTKTHAEADAVNKAILDGKFGKAKFAEMWVDRELCRSCGDFNGVGSLARELGVEKIIVHSPKGSNEFFPPK